MLRHVGLCTSLPSDCTLWGQALKRKTSRLLLLSSAACTPSGAEDHTKQYSRRAVFMVVLCKRGLGRASTGRNKSKTALAEGLWELSLFFQRQGRWQIGKHLTSHAERLLAGWVIGSEIGKRVGLKISTVSCIPQEQHISRTFIAVATCSFSS